MTAMARIIGIIPVHNRRETTLRCLRHLCDTGAMDWIEFCVVDDGSNDGTAAAVRAEFPDISVLAGDGNLWWTGGIALGMRHAVDRGADFIVWLNDDTLPELGALTRLFEISRTRHAIAGGVGLLPGEDAPAYGGFHRSWCRLGPMLRPGTETWECDALSGNLVCLPRSVVEQIGYPDATHLPHAFADIDYTLRARRAGVPVLLVGSAQAKATPNLGLNYRSWLLSDVPVNEWWRQLGRRGSFIYQPAQWRFHWRHWGVAGALYCVWILIKLTAISAIRLVLPRKVLRRWHGQRSAAWKHEQSHRRPTTD